MSGLVFLLAWLACTCAPEAPPGPRPPNLVFVVGCTVRADQTSPWGAPPEVTPFLQEWADDGVRVADVVAQAPWTRPALTALFTGHYPAEVGMVDLDDTPDDRLLPRSVPTLAERLRAAGYVTVGGTANPNANLTYGLGRGFDGYVEAIAMSADDVLGKMDGVELVAKVLAQYDAVAAVSDKPFYLQIVLIDAHRPVTVSEEEVRAFQAPDVSHMVATYRAQLHRFDEAVRVLDQGLAERGIGHDDAIWVLAGDHGEGLNDPATTHGIGHGYQLYPSNTHVPALLRGPGMGHGVVVRGLASQLDLTETVLDLAGLQAIGGGGTSLRPLLADGGTTDRKRVFTSTFYLESGRAAVYTPDWMCQVDLIRTPLRRAFGMPTFVTGCYDPVIDPGFEVPFTDDALMAELDVWTHAESQAMAAFDGAPGAVPSSEEAEMLEALGYRQ